MRITIRDSELATSQDFSQHSLTRQTNLTRKFYFQCEQDVQAKYPYVNPEELIYAQPVALKPVGEPIASIPVRGPPRAIYSHGKPHPPNGIYGSPKPQPNRGFRPPPPPPPGSKPYPGSRPSSQFIGSPSNIYEGPFPPQLSNTHKYSHEFTQHEERPYQFESPNKFSHHKDQFEVIVPAGPTPTPEAQQHIHHHFHHGADGSSKLPTVIVNNPVPATPITTAADALNIINGHKLSSGLSQSSIHSSENFGSLSSGSFSGVSSGLNQFSAASKPVYEETRPQQFGNGGSSLYSGQQSHSGFYGSGASSFGASVGAFGNTGSSGAFGNAGSSGSFGNTGSSGSFGHGQSFYKKELNLNQGPLNGNSLQSGYANQYQGFESLNNANYDCVCVPSNQCPSQDVLGRKDDLYLNIDPRNLGSDIQADEAVVTDGNGTMTVVRVAKEANQNATEVKSITKREAGDETQTEASDPIEPEISNIQPVSKFI